MADDKSNLIELDLLIMDVIRQEPGMWPPSRLASALNRPVSTIEKRVKILKDRQLFRDETRVQLAALGFTLRYRVDVQINPRELNDSREKDEAHEWKRPIGNPQKRLAGQIRKQLMPAFKDSVILEDITILLGNPADLCITVRVRSHAHIFAFVTEGLRTLKGVSNTSTSYEAWSIFGGDFSDIGE